jgi:hypothetical protein
MRTLRDGATEEEKEATRAADRLRKARTLASLTAEEHRAFVQDQKAYFSKW